MLIKILMVDGDSAVLKLAKSTASSPKWCDLATVRDGREAAKFLQNEKFHGLVTADRIPHLDGFELIQHLRQSSLNASIPIVMLTGENDIGTMRQGFKAGVTFFAVKPQNRERFYRLFNAVRGAMETERRRHHRLPYCTPVNCSLGDQNQNRFVAESVEIGEGGIGVQPAAGVQVGQILELEFLFPQISKTAQPATVKSRNLIFAKREMPLGRPQKVRARVRYITPSGESMGLDFQGLTPPQREAIEHYITGDN